MNIALRPHSWWDDREKYNSRISYMQFTAVQDTCQPSGFSNVGMYGFNHGSGLAGDPGGHPELSHHVQDFLSQNSCDDRKSLSSEQEQDSLTAGKSIPPA